MTTATAAHLEAVWAERVRQKHAEFDNDELAVDWKDNVAVCRQELCEHLAARAARRNGRRRSGDSDRVEAAMAFGERAKDRGAFSTDR